MSQLATDLVAAQQAAHATALAAAEDAETAATIVLPLTSAALTAEYLPIPEPAAHPGVAAGDDATVINAVADALVALGVLAAAE